METPQVKKISPSNARAYAAMTLAVVADAGRAAAETDNAEPASNQRRSRQHRPIDDPAPAATDPARRRRLRHRRRRPRRQPPPTTSPAQRRRPSKASSDRRPPKTPGTSSTKPSSTQRTTRSSRPRSQRTPATRSDRRRADHRPVRASRLRSPSRPTLHQRRSMSTTSSVDVDLETQDVATVEVCDARLERARRDRAATPTAPIACLTTRSTPTATRETYVVDRRAWLELRRSSRSKHVRGSDVMRAESADRSSSRSRHLLRVLSVARLTRRQVTTSVRAVPRSQRLSRCLLVVLVGMVILLLTLRITSLLLASRLLLRRC